MGLLRRGTVVGGFSLLAFAGRTSAHEIGGTRFDSPLPLPLLFGGAAATVALTALFLGVTVTTESTAGERRRLALVSPSTMASLRRVFRGLFFVAFALALVTGIFGRQVRAENFATVFVWPVWVKGVGLFAILVGSPWRVLSPWRTIYDALTRLEGRELAILGRYPRWLGEWPALLGFLVGIGILENLTIVPRSPRGTAVVLAAYAFAMVSGGVLFGPVWFRRADALEVLYRLFGRVAPIETDRTSDGGYEISVRPPWRASGLPAADLIVVAFIIATVYTVSFDGFTNTPEFQTLLFTVRSTTGFGPTVSILLYAAGFLGFLVAFVLVVGLTRRVANESAGSWRATARAFAPTVLPIAVAYELAHNYPFVIANLGQLVTVLGEAVLSTTPTVAPLAWLSLPAFWVSQILLIIGGHVVAVIAAHYVALDRYATARRARRAHVPLTALMVGYTVLSLWIISRPVVSG